MQAMTEERAEEAIVNLLKGKGIDVAAFHVENNDIVAYVDEWHRYDIGFAVFNVGCGDYPLFMKSSFFADYKSSFFAGYRSQPPFTRLFSLLLSNSCQGYTLAARDQALWKKVQLLDVLPFPKTEEELQISLDLNYA